MELETTLGERVVVANEDWVALVPYWALWPFEILLLPRRRQILRLPDVQPAGAEGIGPDPETSS